MFHFFGVQVGLAKILLLFVLTVCLYCLIPSQPLSPVGLSLSQGPPGSQSSPHAQPPNSMMGPHGQVAPSCTLLSSLVLCFCIVVLLSLSLSVFQKQIGVGC